MPGKGSKCCCCPACTVQTTCCDCACKAICVTFTPTNDVNPETCESCDIESVELPWSSSEAAYIGSVAGHDLRYYFERVGGVCYFKLRSVSLGYPLGSEFQWTISSTGYAEVSCDTLATEIAVSATVDPYADSPYDDYCEPGVITTECALKHTPTVCTACQCLCDCICIEYIDPVLLRHAFKKACWDDDIQGYAADFVFDNDTIPVSITFQPANEVGLGVDADDTHCVAVLNITGEVRNVDCTGDLELSWTVPYDGYLDIEVNIRCAECDTPCRPTCCPNMPDSVFLTVDTFCFSGIIILELAFIDPNDGTTIWGSVPGSFLIARQCDTLYPFTETDEEIPVGATVHCAGPGISGSIGSEDGFTNFFSGQFCSCSGGTLGPNDPGVTNWALNVGSCCALYMPGQNGTVTLSA